MYQTVNRARLILILLVLLMPLSGCIYGLKSAGGFPANIRTMYVAPIDNRTVKSELDAQLFTALTGRLTRALGLRPAGERNADAVLRVQITRYDDQAQNYRPNNQGGVTVLQHEVQISLAVQIVDVKRNAYLWEGTAVGRGEYRPDTQSDEVARTRAVEDLIQKIVNGAQSQW